MSSGLVALGLMASAALLGGCALTGDKVADSATDGAATGAAAAPASSASAAKAEAPPAPPVQTTVCAAPTEVAFSCKLRSGAELTLCAAPHGEQAYMALLPVGVSDVTAAHAYPSDPTTYRQSFYKEGPNAKSRSTRVQGPKGVFAIVKADKKGAYQLSLVRGRTPQDWRLPNADLRAGCKDVEAAPWMAEFVEQLPGKGKRIAGQGPASKRSMN